MTRAGRARNAAPQPHDILKPIRRPVMETGRFCRMFRPATAAERGMKPILTMIAVLCGAAGLGLAAHPAHACPGADAPCVIEGGAYHALAPQTPAKGMVLFLHGYGGRSDAQIRAAGVVAPLLARGYAVAAPQGMPRRPGDKGGAWNAFADPSRRDDVAFLRAVIADARARLGLTGAPLLAAGFSGGGMMVWRLACDAPDSADAYAPVAGLMWRPLPDRCAGPVRMLHTHGWTDPVVPLEGRSVAGGRITQGDLFAGLSLMRRANGCADDNPDAYDAPGPFLRRAWTDCAPGAALAFAMHPGGHKTPEGWADMALDWFEAQGAAAPVRAGLAP
ncbi:MAG: polyhydroxybutyrate depolymerase [Rhodobacterales bacterium CG18_big_fil_WC_8_21_14_2_50_71_9]|nr:MAG: polyhydroxybutyrate depolymerase [Rhodobacterales bacterium CG18_big_fil_WC_8_21_14_2_50_71_9]PJA60387.1 MAG: polyhydroxybutyrate depolymerase [Rhodobacterales bacterium CG_4_9_14_3_um_filter_71_31]